MDEAGFDSIVARPERQLSGLQDISTELPIMWAPTKPRKSRFLPTGTILCQSNRRLGKGEARGPDTIGGFVIDPSKGALMLVSHAQTGGIMPRSFAIDPTGKFLLAANEVSNNLVFLHG